MRGWVTFLVAALAVPTTACTADSRPTASDFELRGGQTSEPQETGGEGAAATTGTGGELLRRGLLAPDEAEPTLGFTHEDALGPDVGGPVVR
jgi:hypothetical protein